MKIREEQVMQLFTTALLLFVFAMGMLAASNMPRNPAPSARPLTVTVYAAKGQHPVKVADALIKHVETLPGFSK